MLQEESAKAPRQDAHRQEEVWPARHPARAIRGQATCGQQAMEVRVVLELPAPGMEHRQAAELGSEMLRIAADVYKALGHGMKKEGIEHTGILKDEGTEFLR